MRAPLKRREGARQGAPSILSQNSSTPQFKPSALRLQHLAKHLHQLGARAIYELLIELAESYGSGVLDHLETYSQIGPRILRAIGGDRFPAAPLRRVA